MRSSRVVILLALSCLTEAQLLYQCNFDKPKPDDNCFSSLITISSGTGSLSGKQPITPFSDVTSILQPTSNGEVCSLPYKAGYTWDMYFCNKATCPTNSSLSSNCTSGSLALQWLTGNSKTSFQLKTPSSYINGTDWQCIVYYYYMQMDGGKMISVRKEEADNTSEIIDSVTSSPFNGWIRRQVAFKVGTRQYKLFFELQKTPDGTYAPYMALDEISIRQGNCDTQTTSPKTDTSLTSTDHSSTTGTTTLERFTSTDFRSSISTDTDHATSVQTSMRPSTVSPSQDSSPTTQQVDSTATTQSSTSTHRSSTLLTSTSTSSATTTTTPSTTRTSSSTTTTTAPSSTTTTFSTTNAPSKTTTTTSTTKTTPSKTTTAFSTTTAPSTTQTVPSSTSTHAPLTTTATSLTALSSETSSTTPSVSVCSTIYTYLFMSDGQILYQCNFDNLAFGDNCVYGQGSLAMIIDPKFGNPGPTPPVAPLSDVTSSLTPTGNGLSCSLPYKFGGYSWDMYFCNNGFCPTALDNNTACRSGKFAHYNIAAPRIVSFLLSTRVSSKINGTGVQCLTYYYYLPNITGTQQSIRVIKQEVDNLNNVTLDTVSNNFFNGWSKRQIDYNAEKRGYEIYFELTKTSGVATPLSLIALDEISIVQGSCSDAPTTTSTTMPTSTTSATFSTTTTSLTSSTTITVTTEIQSTAAATTTSPVTPENPTTTSSTTTATSETTPSTTSTEEVSTSFTTVDVTMPPTLTSTSTTTTTTTITTSSTSQSTSSTTTASSTTTTSAPSTTTTRTSSTTTTGPPSTTTTSASSTTTTSAPSTTTTGPPSTTTTDASSTTTTSAPSTTTTGPPSTTTTDAPSTTTTLSSTPGPLPTTTTTTTTITTSSTSQSTSSTTTASSTTTTSAPSTTTTHTSSTTTTGPPSTTTTDAPSTTTTLSSTPGTLPTTTTTTTTIPVEATTTTTTATTSVTPPSPTLSCFDSRKMSVETDR